MSNFSKSLNNNLQQKTGGMGLKGMIGTNNTNSQPVEPQIQETQNQPLATTAKVVQKSKKVINKRLPVDLPMDLYDRLAMKKIKVKMSMREMIITAVEQYLEK
jgi:hypothetical protein